MSVVSGRRCCGRAMWLVLHVVPFNVAQLPSDWISNLYITFTPLSPPPPFPPSPPLPAMPLVCFPQGCAALADTLANNKSLRSIYLK